METFEIGGFYTSQNELMTVEVADGILYTEYVVCTNETMNTQYPVTVVASDVRGAHMYNIVFSAMRQNFAISGLLPIIQVNATVCQRLSFFKKINSNLVFIFCTGNTSIRWRLFSKTNGKIHYNEPCRAKYLVSTNSKLSNLRKFPMILNLLLFIIIILYI